MARQGHAHAGLGPKKPPGHDQADFPCACRLRGEVQLQVVGRDKPEELRGEGLKRRGVPAVELLEGSGPIPPIASERLEQGARASDGVDVGRREWGKGEALLRIDRHIFGVVHDPQGCAVQIGDLPQFLRDLQPVLALERLELLGAQPQELIGVGQREAALGGGKTQGGTAENVGDELILAAIPGVKKRAGADQAFFLDDVEALRKAGLEDLLDDAVGPGDADHLGRRARAQAKHQAAAGGKLPLVERARPNLDASPHRLPVVLLPLEGNPQRPAEVHARAAVDVGPRSAGLNPVVVPIAIEIGEDEGGIAHGAHRGKAWSEVFLDERPEKDLQGLP